MAAPRYERKVDAQGRSYATGKRKDAIARVWIKPGNGKITVNDRDIPTVQSTVVLMALFYVLVNLAADVLGGLLVVVLGVIDQEEAFAAIDAVRHPAEHGAVRRLEYGRPVEVHGGRLYFEAQVATSCADTRAMQAARAYRSSGLLRSLTLLRTFLVASAAILAVGAVFGGGWDAGGKSG